MPFHGGERTILKRDAMIVRVTTDTGLRGFAPGSGARGRGGPDPRRHRAVPRRTRSARLAHVRVHERSGAREKTYRAVEIALLDLVARYEGCPLSEIAGGRRRDRIKLYGSAGMYMSPEGYADEAAAVQAMGFPAYKMRPALGPERDLRDGRADARGHGPDFGLMIDAHSWWRMGDRSYSPRDGGRPRARVRALRSDVARGAAAARRSRRLSRAAGSHARPDRHRRARAGRSTASPT